MMGKPALIAFDLDGTLVDSAPDLADAVDAMLATLGRPSAGVEKVRTWIGNGVTMLVKRALTGEMWPAGDPPGFTEALSRFLNRYQTYVCERSRLYDGVLEGLKALKARGYRTACITNKHSRFALPLLRQLGVAAYLDYIGCGDQFDKPKPDPDPLLKTAERFSVEPEDCLMVGDSDNDVKAARAAGFGILCVSYGYRNVDRAEDLHPDGVIPSLAALPAYFD
ncbi:MAG: phosphoglycolate phosphatase [Methylotetracoccus sp.]|jgi:phosphoglycolate phosphatase|nr:phosphoglycolate phosphatase [Methylotetracoccus sp.]